ncbi:CBS domain-containing protein CBSX3, mitochondrial-like isoform X1 [Vigna umbellata]|uniref:CBS domain-containing protein CBSX3, mitochondrial-like isoform X1 n=2 Tax=Vigna umbellata TaxID=87088 RepID=UPI001F5EFE12|nr:CBS domain-containing protein CBSX3, mitochondrial-like isoform X1 [Vigna umbellata]
MIQKYREGPTFTVIVRFEEQVKCCQCLTRVGLSSAILSTRRSFTLSLSLSQLSPYSLTAKMQGGLRTFLSNGNVIKNAVLQRVRMVNPLLQPIASSRFESVTPARIEEHGFESTTIADIMKDKGKGADGSWLWCTTDDTVYDAVKSMTQNNVGALVVVKPDANKAIAGIITERDYLRKIIVQGRSSKSTKVGDIMTEENKLITVTPNTRVLQAMQLMTGMYEL